MAFLRALVASGALLLACNGAPPRGPAELVSPDADAPPALPALPVLPALHALPDAGALDAATGPAAATPADAATARPPEPPGTIRMDADCSPSAAAFERTLRPKFKECYREARKAEPTLEGSVRILVVVDAAGKLAVSAPEKDLPEPVVACMLGAVRATPFDGVAPCKQKKLSFPVSFPTR